MQVKRLYNREIKFLIIAVSSVIILTFTAFFLLLTRDKSDSFEKYLVNKDYKELYGYLESPDFTIDMFKAYMDYQFGSEISVLNKIKNDNSIVYKLKTSQGDKEIKLTSKNKRFIWKFDDYTYNWNISIPVNASIYIQNKIYDNKNGQVVIGKIPAGIYDVKVTAKDCEPYTAKVMSGQNIEIKLNISKETIGKCKDAIEEYLKFREKAYNTKEIDSISCVDKDSGVYKEVVDEVQWLNTVDFKSQKSLESFNVVKGYVNEDGTIQVETLERWNIKIDNDGNLSEKKEEYRNIYTLESGEKYIITQIKTNK